MATVAKNSLTHKNSLVGTVGAAFLASLVLAPCASASANPFQINPLSSGYTLAEADKAPTEGKCGEAKCGAAKAEAAKAKEGACGEAKAKEGSCGEAKATEGKCGEGKCGAKK